MSSDKITVNVTCIDMGFPEHPRESEVVINRAQIITLVSKRKLSQAVLAGTIFEKEPVKNLKLERKSKKHKGYVALESESDFKDFFRSLKVKNMTKLIVRRKALAEPLPQYTREPQPTPIPPAENAAAPEPSFVPGAETVEQFRKLVSEFQKSEIYEFMRSFSRLYTQAMAPEGIFGVGETAEQPRPATPEDAEGQKVHPGTVHKGVMCDNCRPIDISHMDSSSYISGWRYKCLVCDDFDLCEKCHNLDVKLGTHSSHHSMVGIEDSKVFRNFLDAGGFSSGRRCHAGFNHNFVGRGCPAEYYYNTSEVPEVQVHSSEDSDSELETLKEKARLYDELQAVLEGVSDSSFERMKEIILRSKDVAQEGQILVKEVQMAESENASNDSAQETDVSCEEVVPESAVLVQDTEKVQEKDNTSLSFPPEVVTESLDGFKPSLVAVTVVPKGQSLSQVILTNTSDRSIGGDKLTLSIKNCFDTVVASVPIERKTGIQANRTVKFNVGVSNTHFKYPFKVVLSTENGSGECQLSLKNMVGELLFLAKEGSEVDAMDTQMDSDKSAVFNSQFGGKARQGSVSSFMTASVHSILVPSLPKEVVPSSPLAQGQAAATNDDTTMSEKDDGEAHDDYDLISVTDAEVNSDLDSEYEILS